MTAEFTGEEIMDITNARIAAGLMSDRVGSICTDTRLCNEDNWYLALSGERFDGHDFLGDAFSQGSIGAIVEERPGYAIGNPQYPLLAVDNTLEAYHALARNWRKRISPFVVGVTGSSGKTTTKEMCAAVFSGMRCYKSAANENNEFGVPKTLLSMPDDTQVCVVEMAMRGLGQIDQLARCGLPDAAIITNAGTAHLELLGSVENIAKAKSEILKYLHPERGVAIIGLPSEILMNAVAEVWKGRVLACGDDDIEVESVDADGTMFKVRGCPDQVFKVHAHGRPILEDAWCVIQAGLVKGLSEREIAAGLARWRPVEGRGNRLVTSSGALVLDETYNANPDSVKASIAAILDERAFPFKTKIVVLGELAELGPTENQLHREIGSWLKDKPISTLITVGRMARNIADGAEGASFIVLACSDQIEAEKELRSRLSGDACVLIKGSHRANLDKMVSKLVAH
jgi:UDP-N-acetylmuramoyl-tripeptide--D-alanyl-D-alanine ligase